VNVDFIRHQVNLGWQGTTERLYGGTHEQKIIQGLRDSVIDELERSRGAEVREFISKSSLHTWVFGHGFGGVWKSDLMMQGADWPMVHFGPLHLVLRGGILLSVLYMYLFFVAIKRSWIVCKYEPFAASCFCYLIYYMVDFMKHGPVLNAYQFYIVWLVLGFGLSFQKPLQENNKD